MDINFNCFCNELPSVSELIVYLPCRHFAHAICVSKNVLNNINVCGICKNPYEKIIIEENILKSKDKQVITNYKSIKSFNNSSPYYTLTPKSLILFNTCVNKLMRLNTINDIDDFLNFVLSSFNFKIKLLDNTKKNPFIHNGEKIVWKNEKDNMTKIIISNHCSILDGIIIYYLFRCGFVASDIINTISLGRIIVSKIKLLVFKRGEPQGMVEKITDYLNTTKNNLCIFPEGAVSYNNSLLKFRSGAFNAWNVICPIVLNYKTNFMNEDIMTELFLAISQPKIIVDVIINDFEYAPFNIDKIRNKMSKIGKLNKSDVSSRNIIDK
jgi:hypothetical protein